MREWSPTVGRRLKPKPVKRLQAAGAVHISPRSGQTIPAFSDIFEASVASLLFF